MAELSEAERRHVRARELSQSITDRLDRLEPERDLVDDIRRLLVLVETLAREATR